MFVNKIKVIVLKDYPNYAVSACGKVFNIKRNKEIAQSIKVINNYPSCYVRLSVEGVVYNRKVHRLVLEAWQGCPDKKLQVNHKDGNSLNNNVENLEWVTASQNQRHAVSTGLKGKGSDLYNASLTEDAVHKVCQMLVNGHRICDIAKEVNTSKGVIRLIRAGDCYFHIRQLYKIEHNYPNDFSVNTVKWVCYRILDGLGDKEIAKLSSNDKLSTIEIKRIRYKIRYKNISDEFF
jgi:hypothetical protein